MSLISKLGKCLSSEDKYISIISILKEYPLKSHRGIWGVRRYVMPLSSAFPAPLITEEFDYGSSVSPPRCQKRAACRATYDHFVHVEAVISESRLVEKRISDSSLVLVSYCRNNIKILRLIPSKLTRRKKKRTNPKMTIKDAISN